MVLLRHPTPPGQKLAATRQAAAQAEPLILPFTVIADNRERSGGWQFRGLQGDSGDKYRPLVVPLVYQHMQTCDYTLQGIPIFIERKSQDDFISTITHGHKNFQAEHDRMDAIVRSGGKCCVIIEADYEATRQYLDSGVAGRDIPGATVRGNVAAQINDHGIPWMFCSTRQAAEEMAFWVLRKAWERSQKGSR